MKLGMTVGAASVEEKNRRLEVPIGIVGYRGRYAGPRRNRVTRVKMARAADPRIAHFEQPVIDRAVRLVAVGAVFKYRRMLPKKRSAPLGMTGVTVLVNAGLLQLGWIGAAMRVVAIRADDLSFFHRHVRRAHQLRFALEMTLTAHFYFCPLGVEKSLVGSFRQLLATRFFHYRVAVDAGDASARVRARFPVSLHTALMATQARVILDFRRLTRVFAKGDQSADALPAAGGDVIASWTVTALAGLLLHGVARIVEKNFPHQGGGKFFKGRSVAGFANFVAHVGSGKRFGRLFFR